MKKIISMMVAILVTCSALTIHASATWYDYEGESMSKYFLDYWGSYGGVDGDSDYFVSAWTSSVNPDIAEVSVGLSWTTNVTPEFDSETAYDDDTDGEVSVSIDTTHYIESDYTIYAFTSDHTIYDAYGNSLETFYIGTSY